MIVKLLTEHHLEKEAAQARQSLHLSKCQIVGNLMSRLILFKCVLVTKDVNTNGVTLAAELESSSVIFLNEVLTLYVDLTAQLNQMQFG